MTGDRAGAHHHSRRGAWEGLLVIALTVVVLAQSTRVLFPIMYEIGEDWDFVLAGLVAIGTFLTPLLVLAVPPVSARTGRVAGAVLMAGGLVVARLADPIPAGLAIAVVAAVLVGITTMVAHSDLTELMAPTRLVAAVAVGMSSDVVIRAGFGSWDLAWQSGVVSLVAVGALALGLVGLAIRLGEAREAPGGAPAAPRVWIAVGGYVVLQLLFLQNAAFVSSQGGVSPAIAVFTVLAANTVAVAVLGSTRTRLRIVGSAVVAVGLASMVSVIEGAAVLPLLVLLQATLTWLLAGAVTSGGGRRAGRAGPVAAIAGGGVVFLALVLVWALHIDRPLPIPRETIPALAVSVVAAVALSGVDTSESNRGWFSLAFVVGGLAVIGPLVMLATAPRVVVAPATDGRVDLVSYNVRGSVGIDGQLAPDRILEEIVSSDPDIVVLQEVARGWPIHGTLDLVAYLQRELAMDVVFVPAADLQFGNAVLSSLPMAEVDRGGLPRDGSQRRSYVLVRVDAGDQPLFVAATHLHSRSVTQVNALLEAVGERSPLVVAGDMNIAPHDPEISLFTSAGLVDVIGATGDECQTTSAEPTSDCDRPDWVFVTSDVEIDKVRIGTGGASDHLAIHATLVP